MFFKHTWPGFVWALLILILCAIPGKDLPQIWWMELLSVDKLVHATLFAVLIILLNIGFRKQKNNSWLQLHSVRASMFISIPYGFLLEVMQHYLCEGRTFDLWDFAANTFGCYIGYLIYKKRFRIAV